MEEDRELIRKKVKLSLDYVKDMRHLNMWDKRVEEELGREFSFDPIASV